MASPVCYPNMTNSAAYSYGRSSGLKAQAPSNGKSGAPPMTALSIEFVAQPQQAHRVEAAIPAAVAGRDKGPAARLPIARFGCSIFHAVVPGPERDDGD